MLSLYSSVYFYHLFLISSASVKSIQFLSFIEPIFAWNVPLVSLIFLNRSLVFHQITWWYFWKFSVSLLENYNQILTKVLCWLKGKRADETKEGLGMQEQIKWSRVLECRNGKNRPLSTFSPIPNVVTINEFQVLLTSITCLPSFLL